MSDVPTTPVSEDEGVDEDVVGEEIPRWVVDPLGERKAAQRRLNILVGVIVGLVVAVVAIFAITIFSYRSEIDDLKDSTRQAEERADEAVAQRDLVIAKRTNFAEVMLQGARTNLCVTEVRSAYDTAIGNIVISQAAGQAPTPQQIVALENALAAYQDLDSTCPQPQDPLSPAEPESGVEPP